jgi:hypothetical protein
MRRILTTVVASSLLALALPAAASAHHHRHRHHHKAHTVVFAPPANHSTTNTTPTTPTTEPTATVASFENGVLKITLPDGSTVSGKVTESTWISCGCSGHQDFGGSPEWQHDGSQGDQGDDNNDQGGNFADHHGDWEQGSSPQSTEGCDASALVPGAKIQEAELNVSSAGAVWEKVELFPKA